MQVTIEKTFSLEASSDTVWQFLQDIPRVSGCLPGAEITQQVDDTHYKGKVKAKIGPATMAFNGEIEIKNLNPDKHELQMVGRGQDTKGSSSAQMDLTAWVIQTDDGQSKLQGKAVVTVTGKVATFGGRMMTQVSDQILNQFGKNFSHQVNALQRGETGETGKGPPAKDTEALDGLSIAGAVISDSIKNLFGTKKKE